MGMVSPTSPWRMETVSILLGTGTGSFGPATNFAVGSYPSSVAIGDLNGDGKLDLAVANFSSNNVSILLGDGTRSFGPRHELRCGIGSCLRCDRDFNGDGKLDMAVANQGSGNISTVSVLLGDGTGSFDQPQTLPWGIIRPLWRSGISMGMARPIWP